MDRKKIFEKFCKQIDFKFHHPVLDTEMFQIGEGSDKSLNFVIEFKQIPNALDFFTLLKKIKAVSELKLNIKYHFNVLAYKIEQIREYLNVILSFKTKYSKLKKINFQEQISLINENELCFHFTNDAEKENYLELLSALEKTFIKYGFVNIKISHRNDYHNFVSKVEVEKEVKEKPNKEILKDAEKHFKNLIQNELEEKETISNNNGFKKTDYGLKNNTFTEVKIEEIETMRENQAVCISGVVFKKEIKSVKNAEWYVRTLGISDHNVAIFAQEFSNKKFDKNDIEEGNFVKVFGRVASQKYGEKIIKVSKLEKIEDIFASDIDLAPKPRYEFHVSSKMNTMDGLIEASEFIDCAKNKKIAGGAILDLNTVQAFPDFYNYSKNKPDFKPIFGATFSTISKNNRAVYGKLNDLKFSEIEFVSFDLETTSLSPRFGDIIEFGSQNILNSKLKESEQFFLKTSNPLSSFTKGLTNITDEMLEQKGLEQKEGLKKIYDILNNKVAIAHNASFDMNWLIEKYHQYGMKAPNTIYIDSLIVSRIVFEDAKRYRLQNLANKLGIEYNVNEAHRADYDALVLAKVWIALQNKIILNHNINNLKELNSYTSKSLYERAFSDEYTIIAKNQQGLKKLFKLISKSLTEDFYNGAKLFVEDLPVNDPDLLIGSSTLKGALWDAFLYRSEKEFLNVLQKVDFVEIPHPGVFKHILDSDITVAKVQQGIKDLIKYANEYNKIPIAVSDAKYLEKREELIYKILIYSKGIKNSRHHLYNYEKAKSNSIVLPEAYLLSTSEMKKAFSFIGDEKIIDDIVVENTYKIAQKIENIQVIKDKLYTPKLQDSKEKLYALVYKNAHEKYGEKLPKIVEERIEKEIQPIMKYGYDVIYWISHGLVQKSLDNGYLVGSRGSVGSSFVATMSGITEVNPLVPHYLCSKCKYFEIANLPDVTSGFDLPNKKCPKCDIELLKDGQTIPFETFLGFNADKVPDIDLNFSGEYQGEIHNEIRRLFGKSHTFRAGTISKIKEKTAFGYIKSYCEETNDSFSNAYISYLAYRLNGVKRTTGKHAGGIIVIPAEFEVEDFTPINYAANATDEDWFTTHFNFEAIHDNVLKFDILGHDDPTALRMLQKITKIDPKKIPNQDEKVISIFSSTKDLNIKPSDISGETTGALGLPEFGTNFVRNMLKSATVKSFADLISLSGLSHGTDVWNNNAEELIRKKNFAIKDVISCRDEIMNSLIKYGVDASYSFKIMEKVRKGKGLTAEEETYLKEHNVPNWYIDSMQKIEYMFPKAHATAYVLMAWRIAWFKVYYPLEYYATYFSTRSDDFDIQNMIDIKGGTKVTNRLAELNSKKKSLKGLDTKEEGYLGLLEITQEMYARGFSIQNINLELSKAKEWVIDKKDKSLIPPFSSIPGLGESAAENIIKARKEKQFISIEDFSARTSTTSTVVKLMKEMNIFKGLDDTDQLKLF
ncbi:PolC-type DNA polymerase III [Mycoplasmopsis hyopharyngis]|uniref:PolC-type DNA polymerase III n=1 Tax=Mycoplasmopsis hyopharyngis TaxID=29558 RepID=UPI00387302AE